MNYLTFGLTKGRIKFLSTNDSNGGCEVATVACYHTLHLSTSRKRQKMTKRGRK
jgi:hypothetical protein